ncbi:hypothetical protein [Massilia niastensis]|uniref:hypothetical protein n=1 Tax=Massilia niastensis TaxID=544911 RepID=UPI00037F9AA7|nr:hypothetical protein [Massilia niastensis]
MARIIHAWRAPLMGWLFLLPLAATSASANASEPLRCSPAPGSSGAGLARAADATRAHDRFYQQLVAWKGKPSGCRGKVGSEEAGRLEFTWPDQSTFETSWMPPETSVVRYSRAQGLDREKEVVARFREYAERQGLRMNWEIPTPMHDGDARILEYRDPEVNGSLRFTYDRQQRLIAVSLSLAL